MDPLLQDLRTGFRQLLRRPGTYLVALQVGFSFDLLSAMWLKRADLLADIPPGDPDTYLTVLLIVMVVALTAVGFPTLRASRTHTMRALRYE